METPKRAAFVRTATWPPANARTYEALRNVFPDVAFDLVEVHALLKRRYGLMIRNTIETVHLYGPLIARRKRSLRDCFFRTGYLFDQLKLLFRIMI